MGLIKTIIAKHKEKVKDRNNTCDNLIAQVDEALNEINILFEDSQSFVEHGKEDEWRNHNASLIANVNITNIQKLKRAIHYKRLLNMQRELYRNADLLKQKINDHNDRAANARVQTAYTLIGDVEGRKLDKQQMTCIVKEFHNHLVIAGAGTGKTTTVVGKIKYLLKSEKCKPEDILVLSFTNASAAEMSQRIHQETGCNIEAL